MVEQLSLKASLKATPWFSQHALHNRGILRIYCLQMADERRGAGAQALCLCTQFIKSQIKGSVGIQGGRKQRCKDTINPYNETSKSCPLPGAVCIWTPGRKWHALQSLWSEIAFFLICAVVFTAGMLWSECVSVCQQDSQIDSQIKSFGQAISGIIIRVHKTTVLLYEHIFNKTSV